MTKGKRDMEQCAFALHHHASLEQQEALDKIRGGLSELHRMYGRPAHISASLRKEFPTMYVYFTNCEDPPRTGEIRLTTTAGTAALLFNRVRPGVLASLGQLLWKQEAVQ